MLCVVCAQSLQQLPPYEVKELLIQVLKDNDDSRLGPILNLSSGGRGGGGRR